MLYRVKGREITRKGMKKNALESCTRKESGSRRSFWICMGVIVSLSRSVVRRFRSRRLKLVYGMRMGRRFR